MALLVNPCTNSYLKSPSLRLLTRIVLKILEILRFASMGGIGFFSQQHYYPALDNFTIDINLLRAAEANGVKRIFYPSSACAYPVYRMNEGALLSEKMLSEPADPDQMYGWQKLTMLKLLEYSPLDCRVGLLHTIYGPGQSYKGIKAKFPPQIAYKAIVAQKSHEISVWGNGKQTRTFLYINDAVRKIYEVMNKKKYFGPVNIGSSKEVTVNEVVEICCQILNIKPKIIHDLDKPVGPLRRRCSNRKFNQHYKTGEETSLKEGFRRIINHILNTET